jgi:Clr5 domain
MDRLPVSREEAPLVRAQSQQDLDDRRRTIEQLYWCEDRELPDVVELMKSQYGFSATYVFVTNPSALLTLDSARQYKRAFVRWGLKKNVPAQDMNHLIRIRKRRSEVGKDTEFYVRKCPVLEKKIDRFISDHPNYAQGLG